MHYTVPFVATLLAAAASPAFSAPTGTLNERAAVGCKSAFQCRSFKKPMNSNAVCVENVCSYQCLDGYTDYGNRCVKTQALTWFAAPTATSSSAAAPSPTFTLTPNALQAANITAFAGNNTNAILSWYDTNKASDSTNGRGWCEFQYTNDMPGFAPSLKTMLANFNGDAMAAKKAYCGLEALVKTPDGREAKLFVVDAFDDAWVLTPSSLDIVKGSFAQLYGSEPDSKMDVVKAATWSWTGNRREDYVFHSSIYQIR